MPGLSVTIRCPSCGATTSIHCFGWDIKNVQHVCAIEKSPGADPAMFQITYDPPRPIY